MNTQKYFYSALIAVMIALAIPICARAQTQLELDEQAAAEFKVADAELNATYKILVTTLDDEGKKKLVIAEKAWIAFRDAECDSEADEFRGGSIQPMISSECATRLTKARTKDLKDRIKGIGN